MNDSVKPDPFNGYALLCFEQRSLQLGAGGHKLKMNTTLFCSQNNNNSNIKIMFNISKNILYLIWIGFPKCNSKYPKSQRKKAENNLIDWFHLFQTYQDTNQASQITPNKIKEWHYNKQKRCANYFTKEKKITYIHTYDMPEKE
jgi:hypothetical protein